MEIKKSPANACRHCGSTAYCPVIARDESGAMKPSGIYRCVGCKLEFQNIDAWRARTDLSLVISHLATAAAPATSR